MGSPQESPAPNTAQSTSQERATTNMGNEYLDKSGSLSIEEFMSLPELQQNPLVRRVIDIFDDDGNGEVDFKEFIMGLSHFSAKGDMESKLRFAFRISIDNDGFVSN